MNSQRSVPSVLILRNPAGATRTVSSILLRALAGLCQGVGVQGLVLLRHLGVDGSSLYAGVPQLLLDDFQIPSGSSRGGPEDSGQSSVLDLVRCGCPLRSLRTNPPLADAVGTGGEMFGFRPALGMTGGQWHLQPRHSDSIHP